METRDQKENWKKALSEASVDPSPAVWEGVELQLDKLEVTKLRSTLVFYKWLAAACVTAAVVAMSFSYYVTDKKEGVTEETKLFSENRKASDIESTKSENTQTNSASLSTKTLNEDSEGAISTPRVTETSTTKNLFVHSALVQQNSSSDVYGTSLRGNTFSNTLPFTWRANALGSTSGLTQQQNRTTSTSETATIPSPLQKVEETNDNAMAVALLDELQNEEDTKPTNRQQEKFWTSIGFSAGTFANTTPTSAATTSSTLHSLSAGQTAASESNSPGYTYAVNVAVGTKVAKRWLIQGGMSYIAQLSDYTATSVVTNPGDQQTFMAASINQFEKSADRNSGEAILASTPYLVNNNIQLISFPVQAGYMVVDRKLAFQINSGISTDLFMQNTITPQAANLEKSTQGRGDDSPYRPVNFSGLMGTEVSYRFGENYRISLSPGLRYPFNSIYKTNLGIKSSPLTFDVAVRFRYILK